MGAHLSKNTDVTLLVGRTLGELREKIAQINAALMSRYKFYSIQPLNQKHLLQCAASSILALQTADSMFWSTENGSTCFHQ